MSRLPRPRIPLRVRVDVAVRQISQDVIDATPGTSVVTWGIYNSPTMSMRSKLDCLLKVLFGDQSHRAELHHRPALVNRKKIFRNGVHVGYSPPANDREHLVYLLDDEHDVETRVRGVGAQHSDLGLRRKNKKIEKRLKAGLKVGQRPNRGFTKRTNKLTQKMKSCPLRSANRWPPKGSRKIAGRKKR